MEDTSYRDCDMMKKQDSTRKDNEISASARETGTEANRDESFSRQDILEPANLRLNSMNLDVSVNFMRSISSQREKRSTNPTVNRRQTNIMIPMFTLLLFFCCMIYPCVSVDISGLSAADIGAGGISLQMFTRLFFSEVDLELDSSSYLWESATMFEWQRLADKEKSDNTFKAPFLICNSVDRISGEQRRVGIIRELNQAETFKMVPAHNSIDTTCFIAHVQPSIAAQLILTPTSFTSVSTSTSSADTSDSTVIQPTTGAFGGSRIQPFFYAMKLLSGSIKKVRTEQPFSDPILDIMMCPNVLESKDSSGQDAFQQKLVDYLTTTASSSFEEHFIEDTFWGSSNINGMPPTQPDSWTKEINTHFYIDTDECNGYFSQLKFDFDQAAFPFDGTTTVTISSTISSPTETEVQVAPKHCSFAFLLGASLMPEVCQVQVRSAATPMNLQAQWITQSDTEQYRPFFDAGIFGGNQVVAVSDTGLDVNNCYFWDKSNSAISTHTTNNFASSLEVNEADNYYPFSSRSSSNPRIDTSKRKVVLYNSYVNNQDSSTGHGTHVCGTIAGHKSIDGITETIGFANGVAMNAKIAMIDIGNNDGQLTIPPVTTLLGTGRPKAKIHNVSWGTRDNVYGMLSRNFDAYLYLNEDFNVFVAAGNLPPIPIPNSEKRINKSNTIGDPATSKNVITVGASDSEDPNLQPYQRGRKFVTSFSANGPTADGRTKPDIIAPGSWILSASSNPNIDGECDPPFPPRPDQKQGGLASMQGTSMAAAVASGSAALVREYLEEGYWPYGRKVKGFGMSPSGALVKAILLNGAEYLVGAGNNVEGFDRIQPYDNTQNFGRINLSKSLRIGTLNSVPQVHTVFWDDQEIQDRSPAKRYDIPIFTYDGQCTAPVLSITLAWMDPPSTAGCKSGCLLNDLDLQVIRNGNSEYIFHPNGKREKDSINNAERIQIPNAQDGDLITILVNAPNLVTQSQKYALTVTGCFDELSLYSSEERWWETPTVQKTVNKWAIGLFASFVMCGLLMCSYGIMLEFTE